MHYTFVTEFKLALLVRQEVSEFERQGVETRNVTLFGKLTQQEDGRLMSQNHHLFGVWMLGSFMDQRWGGGEERK